MKKASVSRRSSVEMPKQNSMMGNLDSIKNEVARKKELKDVVNSKDTKAKGRYMVKQIDRIYKQANKDIIKNVGSINKEINTWAIKNEMPNNP
jgi:hypothetical protein